MWACGDCQGSNSFFSIEHCEVCGNDRPKRKGSRKVKLAIIGCGRMGKFHSSNVLNKFSAESELVALVDPFGDCAKRLAADLTGGEEPTGMCVLTDTTEFFSLIENKELEVDAVIVATPAPTHKAVCIASANLGLHIFCEKPLCNTVEDCQEVLDAVIKNGVLCQVGFMRRFDKCFGEVKKSLFSSSLCTLQSNGNTKKYGGSAIARKGVGVIGCPQLGKIISYDAMLSTEGYYKSSGGLFLDMMIHDIDMARYMVGSEVIKVHTTASVLGNSMFLGIDDIDTAVVTLSFLNGAIVTIENSRFAVYGADTRIEFFGRNGAVSGGRNLNSNSYQMGTKDGMKQGPLVAHFRRFLPCFTLEIGVFIESILLSHLSRTPPSLHPIAANCVDGLRSVEIALACGKSRLTGVPVVLDPLCLGNDGWTKKDEIKIGVTQWTLDSGDPAKVYGFEALKIAKELGFEAIQIDSGAGGWRGFPNLADEDVVNRYKEEMEATGIPITSIAINVFIDGVDSQITTEQGFLPLPDGGVSLLSSGDELKRGLEYVQQAINAACELGVKYLMIPCFFASAIDTFEDLELAANFFTEICCFAAERG
eukprot:CAMPEP_0174275108 /NCGR_PEP_ID=MMETSP0439-20130205/59649_1 /TAXON_ID=0 /ORGANISM="Stereomyxa ramosa, Strain Chinc5" /LENGTH=590 /DNA_ID=CAMNT_0015367187 /DNA_START=33 /DNA_END=1805 /DNA_ORIENTATION=+